jgi:hypothetical protein
MLSDLLGSVKRLTARVQHAACVVEERLRCVVNVVALAGDRRSVIQDVAVALAAMELATYHPPESVFAWLTSLRSWDTDSA